MAVWSFDEAINVLFFFYVTDITPFPAKIPT